MKKVLRLFVTAGLALALAGCGSSSSSSNADLISVANTDTMTGKVHIAIEVQDYGTIKAELNADIAPATVTNFVNLANEGFYDGLTFHRVIEEFMIQGGDPAGNGTGGSELNVEGEFSSNNIENPLSHTRGAISMARSSAYDSASSQFFIVQADATYLDGDYACFGYVYEGMDVVDQIAANTAVSDNNGTVASGQQPVITSITVID
ncbi:MAG: peptidylprolyl isomerase [Erysipelotrichaceae bacterium]|nr:peptidylprolyl isomerase [Erysipelotrichaceae bacterium]MDD3809484.1 peptidylprolyl isomerase [Erysipelotrichaceae bacterium]